MEYLQINEYSRLYEFDPNQNYEDGSSAEEKLFCDFLKQYKWEKYKYQDYNSGKRNIGEN